MFSFIKKYIPRTMSRDELDEIYGALEDIYQKKTDPWGLDLKKSRASMKLCYPFFKNYFDIRVIGKENVENKKYLVISNHTGQIPIDGALITSSFMTEIKPPRILRTMVERFVGKIPFFGNFVFENGAVLGDRTNAYHLLNHGESVLVFPEGVRGISKSTKDFYKLQEFTRGFFRLALKTQTDILPIAVIGAEEFYPYVYQAKSMAKKLGLPSLPLTPFFPGLGPMGILPLPSPVDIIIGKPYEIPKKLSCDAHDELIDEHVYAIENQVKELIQSGQKHRRKFWGSDILPSLKKSSKKENNK